MVDREPGRHMASEMGEQPGVLRRLLAHRSETADAVRRVVPPEVAGIILVARGSSDHAANYGRYVFETTANLPVAFAAPSLYTLYRMAGRRERQVAIAVSQSGRTPEIVTVLERLQESGATGIAVTNDTESPLAEAADAVIPLRAGKEHAIPATKTFIAQLAIFAIMAEALAAVPWSADDWDAVIEAVEWTLHDDDPPRRVAAAIVDVQGLITVGRTFLFGVALETALKLKEAAGVLAAGYSAADLRHGPIAVIEQDFPVLAFRAQGPAAQDMDDLVKLLQQRGARVFTIADQGSASLPLPAGLPEPLTAFPATARGQQIAYELARQRGLDPDRPPGLTKVTPTR